MTRSEASAEPGGHPKQGAVTPRRRAVGKTRLSPSQGSYRRPTSLCPMPVRPHGRGLSQAPPRAPSGCRPSDTQPHVACMGVETIASRAVTSLYLLIRRYSKRHGLHRPREVGRRAAGRCASGVGRACLVYETMARKGLIAARGPAHGATTAGAPRAPAGMFSTTPPTRQGCPRPPLGTRAGASCARAAASWVCLRAAGLHTRRETPLLPLRLN